jgi:hypothetical protein
MWWRYLCYRVYQPAISTWAKGQPVTSLCVYIFKFSVIRFNAHALNLNSEKENALNEGVFHNWSDRRESNIYSSLLICKMMMSVLCFFHIKTWLLASCLAIGILLLSWSVFCTWNALAVTVIHTWICSCKEVPVLIHLSFKCGKHKYLEVSTEHGER